MKRQLLILAGFCLSVTSPVAAEVAQPGKVWAVSNPAALRHFKADDAIVERMTNKLVTAATGTTSSQEAWGRLVRPTDTVGIKINTHSGSVMGTRRSLVLAVAKGLQSSGIPSSRIIVWDRSRADLEHAGYLDRAGKSTNSLYSVRWIEEPRGYDRGSKVYASRAGTLMWGDLEFEKGPGEKVSNSSFLPTLLTKEVTAIIHLPSAVQARGPGIFGAIAGMTAGVCDNWRRFFRGDASSLAEMYATEAIVGKVRFTIMDGLITQFAGGPRSSVNDSRVTHTLWGGFDPVALDTVALEQIDRLRAERAWAPIKDEATHLLFAEQIGLGSSHISVQKL
jgi:uncharacterized protein (DUF362 family)